MKELYQSIINGDTINMSATFYFMQGVVKIYVSFIVGAYYGYKIHKHFVSKNTSNSIYAKPKKPLMWWWHKVMCEIGWSLRFKFDFGSKIYYSHLRIMCDKYGINLYGERVYKKQS